MWQRVALHWSINVVMIVPEQLAIEGKADGGCVMFKREYSGTEALRERLFK